MIDSDLIPETNVLKNKLGITDQTLLDQAEEDITYLKLLDIDAFFEGRNLDYAALLYINKYIFGNLYEWAGTQRNLNIYKAEKVLNGLSLTYSDYSRIEFEATQIIDEMNAINWSILNLEEIGLLFADLLAKLWLIHPFREGNTRTVMRFAGLFAASKGFSLNSKLLRDKAAYVRDALVLYNVTEAPEKHYFIKLIEDSINQY